MRFRDNSLPVGTKTRCVDEGDGLIVQWARLLTDGDRALALRRLSFALWSFERRGVDLGDRQIDIRLTELDEIVLLVGEPLPNGRPIADTIMDMWRLGERN